MTWVKSRILHPDGTPIVGQCVKATLMTRPSWLNDSTGRVIGRVTTNTGPDGLWRVNLLPYTRIESQSQLAYYVINEGDGSVSYIRVPEVTDPTTELWLRDLLIDPPGPPDTPWISINRLSRLHDVDRASLLAAKPGDYLTLLPSGKWGASRGPMPLTISWTPDPDILLGVLITVAGYGGAGARLGFGDGSPEVVVTTGQPTRHVYAEPGTYILTAQDVAWPGFTGSAKVTVKDHAPRAFAFLDGDDNWTVQLWLDEPTDDTRYTIDWADGSPIQELRGHRNGRVPPKPRVPHPYAKAGTYRLLITDLATQRQSVEQITTGQIGILVSYDAPKRPRLEMLYLATGASYRLDLSGPVPHFGVVPASGRIGHGPNHDVPAGDWPISITETVAGVVRRVATRRYVQPTQWDWSMDVAMTWRAHDDPQGKQTVTVTPRATHTPCTLEWGDGAPSVVVDPGQTATHIYTLPAPAAGWRLRLTETSVEEPRVWSRVLGEPRFVGTPTLSARSTGAVELHIAGLDHEYNDDWYSIGWGDGGDIAAVGAVGKWFPANHIYRSNGVFQIVVDGPGMAAPITRTIEVVTYPAPTLSVVEARDETQPLVDPERRTARITVDNTASGGPCTVDLGDGTAPVTTPETFTFEHVYEAGPDPRTTYYIIATSNADRSAKARVPVSIPFGAQRSLTFEVTGTGYQATLRVTGKTPGSTVRVAWGDGTPLVVVPPSDEVSHTYDSDNLYSITVSYADGSESWDQAVMIPWPSIRSGR